MKAGKKPQAVDENIAQNPHEPGGAIAVRRIRIDDREWIRSFIRDRWGSESIVVHGDQYDVADLDGLVGLDNEKVVGLLTWVIKGEAVEIVSLDSVHERRGVGTALVRAALSEARNRSIKRLWLVTTNDNLHALGFWQKQGFRLSAWYPNAVEKARVLKPQIPFIGENGIPIRDELELEMVL